MDNTNIQPLSKTEESSQPVAEEVAQYDLLTTEEKEKVDAIIGEVDITDSAAVLQYGVQAQSNISGFADKILNQVRMKDNGYVGEILSDLMTNVKNMDVDSLNGDKGLRIFGGMKRKADKFMTRYEKVGQHIDKAVSELDKSRMQLLKDITLLDNLYDNNLDYHKELGYYIIAGEKKIEELKVVTLPEMTAKAKESGDPADAQKVNDFNQLLNRFEKKVHDLKLSRMITLQTGPQVRLIQGNDQVLVEKIQSSILNTIPLWKNQIIIAVSLFRQEKALKQQQEVAKTTNDLLTKNSDLLKQNSIDVAKESERDIVEIETLRKVNQDLIDTIEETLQIQHEGSARRAAAELELNTMEEELKHKLREIKN